MSRYGVFDAPYKWYIGFHGDAPCPTDEPDNYWYEIPENFAIVNFVNVGQLGLSNAQDEEKLRTFLFNDKWIYAEGSHSYWNNHAKLYMPGDTIFNLPMAADLRPGFEYFNIWRKSNDDNPVQQRGFYNSVATISVKDLRRRPYIDRPYKDKSALDKKVHAPLFNIDTLLHNIVHKKAGEITGLSDGRTDDMRRILPNNIIYMFTCQPNALPLNLKDKKNLVKMTDLMVKRRAKEDKARYKFLAEVAEAKKKRNVREGRPDKNSIPSSPIARNKYDPFAIANDHTNIQKFANAYGARTDLEAHPLPPAKHTRWQKILRDRDIVRYANRWWDRLEGLAKYPYGQPESNTTPSTKRPKTEDTRGRGINTRKKRQPIRRKTQKRKTQKR